jgi:hypothetical protein
MLVSDCAAVDNAQAAEPTEVQQRSASSVARGVLAVPLRRDWHAAEQLCR